MFGIPETYSEPLEFAEIVRNVVIEGEYLN